MAKSRSRANQPTEEQVVAQKKSAKLENNVENVVVENDNIEDNLDTTDDLLELEDVSENVGEQTANVKEDNQPEVEEVAHVEVGEKLVNCLGLKSHTARIGGLIYEVIKDKTQQFPPNVAVLLQRSGHLIVK